MYDIFKIALTSYPLNFFKHAEKTEVSKILYKKTYRRNFSQDKKCEMRYEIRDQII